MNRRDTIQLEKLEALEAESLERLVPCLEQCARGRWGLFWTFDYLGEARKYWNWPEAGRLRELAVSIQAILGQSGGQDALCQEFLDHCTIHTQNDPGEPKLAQAFLNRMEKEGLCMPFTKAALPGPGSDI
jgi:hypothetical protein